MKIRVKNKINGLQLSFIKKVDFV